MNFKLVTGYLLLVWPNWLLLGHEITKRNAGKNCGQPEKLAKRVEECLHVHEENDASCSYPSAPRNLDVKFIFNKKTRKFKIKVSWDAPEYGLMSIWGYEVRVNEHCYQINTKNMHQFELPIEFAHSEDDYRNEYSILVSSLPRSSSDFRNSIGKDLRLPDKCAVFAQNGIYDSFDCLLIRNTTVHLGCMIGANNWTVVRFAWPKSSDYDGIEFYGEKTGSCHRNKLEKGIFLTRGNFTYGSFMVENMVMGCNITIWARTFKENSEGRKFSRNWQQQLVIYCRNVTESQLHLNTTSTEKMIAPTRGSLLVILFSIFTGLVFILTSIVLWVKMRKRREHNATDLFMLNGHNTITASSTESPMVSIILSHGCKATENFVLLFASLLHQNGVTVKLDLLENNEVSVRGSMATYLIDIEDAANFVIIVCDGNEDNSFKFILDVIKEKVWRTGSKSRYIPIYFDESELHHVPVWLHGVACQVPDDTENILRRIFSIQQYNIESTPKRNDIVIDQVRLDELKKATTCILEIKHMQYICSMGVIEGHQRCDETSSNNSFTSNDL